MVTGVDSFFAAGQNFVNTFGTGIASVYGTLIVEYYPSSVTAVTETRLAPANFRLDQIYPNPFNPTTEIRYQISEISNVSLKVYDILGREVATLVNGKDTAGRCSVKFDGSRLASGVCFYRLIAGSFGNIKNMVVLK